MKKAENIGLLKVKTDKRPTVTYVPDTNGEVVGRRTTHIPYTHALILQRNEEVERANGYNFNHTDPMKGEMGGAFELHVLKWLRSEYVADAKKKYEWKRWLSGDQAPVYEIVPVGVENERDVDQITPQEKADLMAAYYARRPDIKKLDDELDALDVQFNTFLDELPETNRMEVGAQIKSVHEQRTQLRKVREEQAALEIVFLGRWTLPKK